MKKLFCVFLTIALVVLSVAPSFAQSRTKLIALTYDDGPGPYTDELLDVLKKKNVKASFFVLGTRAEQYSSCIKRMFDEGHQIALHSLNHPNFTSLQAEGMQWQIFETKNAVTEAVGSSIPYFSFRPPYGSYNDSVRSSVDCPFIMWSIDSRDWENHDSAKTCQRIIDAAFDGAIVLQHDIQKCSIEATSRAIDTLKARGYEFVTVDELFSRKGIALEAGKVYSLAKNETLYTDANSIMLSDGSLVKDLKPSDWFADAAKKALDAGYINLDEGLFYPGRPLSRLDVIELLYRLSGSPDASKIPSAGFTDYNSEILNWAYANKIAGGYSDGSFRPNYRVSRQEFASFFCRYLDLSEDGTTASPDLSLLDRFKDKKSVAKYAEENICRMIEKGLLSGNDKNEISPLLCITRAQAASIITRPF